MQSLSRHPKQANVLMYTKDYCPYCDAAARLLTQKGVAFEEIDVAKDPQQLEIMLKLAAPARTVPQIVVGDKCLGGFDDIKALEEKGDLEALLFPAGRE